MDIKDLKINQIISIRPYGDAFTSTGIIKRITNKEITVDCRETSGVIYYVAPEHIIESSVYKNEKRKAQ